MDSTGYISLAVGVLTFISGLIAILASRRKTAAEAHNLDADAVTKFQESLTKLQERNDSLYQENVQLQIKVTETGRSNEQLRIRLEERDAQLTATTKNLDLLRDMAKSANLTEPLKEQLTAMNTIVTKMQDAQSDLAQLLKDREQAYKELFDSTRNLQMKKVKEP